MTHENRLQTIHDFWVQHNATLLLILLLLIFSAYSVFLSCNLQREIIPDEPYRFEISQHFAATWGIPENVPAAVAFGDNLQRNAYLGYWIFGRALALYRWVVPAASGWQQLVALRLLNSAFSLGTAIFTYLIAKQLIRNKWWQLLPVFLLTNTLMFVFLSGGVSYDNPANLCATVGIYFLLRSLTGKDFLANSLGWMIAIAAGTLIKRTILPLALVMGLVWLIYLLRQRPSLDPKSLKNPKMLPLLVIFTLLIILNLALYGTNLVQFQSLTPKCSDTYPLEVCRESVFGVRHQQLGLDKKLTVVDAVRQGYPDPLRYTFEVWLREMTRRIFGIMGHKTYYPVVISYFQIALVWMLLLGVRTIEKPDFKLISLLGIFGFYTLVLLGINYDSELTYGFIQVAVQGRYLFPVYAILVTLYATVLSKVPHPAVRRVTLLATLILFFYGGPIRFVLYRHSVFADWFI